MSKHTQEPWAVGHPKPERGDLGIYGVGEDGGRRGIALVGVSEFDIQEDNANAARIVACVNALQGLDPAGVAGVVGEADGLVRLVNAYDDGIHDTDALIALARRLADNMAGALAALRGGR